MVPPHAKDDGAPMHAVTTANSSTSESKWRDRRHRRRRRQREARATARAALSCDANDTSSHHHRTSRRLLRNAVRNQIKEDMVRPSSAWRGQHMPNNQERTEGDGGGDGGGLRIMIECGFDHLMDSEAEIKSLVTQLQLSYANCLGLVADAVLERWEQAVVEGAEERSALTVLAAEAAEGTGDNTCADHQQDMERPLAKDRHRAEAKRLLAFAAADDCHDNDRDDHEASALHVSNNRSIKPVSLVFTSFQGRVAEATGRDGGSKNWAVRTSELSFGQVAAGIGGGLSNSKPLRVVVLSPDAPEALAGAPDRDALYVVGGICDYKRHMNATLDCAASANDSVGGTSSSSNVVVEARRLPIEETFQGSVSVNILTVNQAVGALVRADINGGDWAEALMATLPLRKLRS